MLGGGRFAGQAGRPGTRQSGIQRAPMRSYPPAKDPAGPHIRTSHRLRAGTAKKTPRSSRSAQCTRSTTPRAHHQPGRQLRDDRPGQHAYAVPAAEKAALGRHPRHSAVSAGHGRVAGMAHHQDRAGTGLGRVRRRSPGRRLRRTVTRKGQRPSRSSASSPGTAGPILPPRPPGVRSHWETENKFH